MAAAMMAGPFVLTSCEEIFGEWDKPAPAVITPDLTPTPDPTPTPTPTPTPDAIEQAKQLLQDAQNDGAVVKAAFTYNGKAYEATFKRENGAFTLQTTLGDDLDATLQEVAGATAQDPDNFIFTIHDKTSDETLLQAFINTAEDSIEVKTADENVTFSGVSVNGETVVMTPTDPSSSTGDEDETVYVTGITLNKTSLEVKVGADPVQLQATILPADATYKDVKWTTSNKSVATVDETGKVTFKHPGKATITVTATNGTDDTADDKTATCEVTVLGGLEDYNNDEEKNW